MSKPKRTITIEVTEAAAKGLEIAAVYNASGDQLKRLIPSHEEWAGEQRADLYDALKAVQAECHRVLTDFETFRSDMVKKLQLDALKRAGK